MRSFFTQLVVVSLRFHFHLFSVIVMTSLFLFSSPHCCRIDYVYTYKRCQFNSQRNFRISWINAMVVVCVDKEAESASKVCSRYLWHVFLSINVTKQHLSVFFPSIEPMNMPFSLNSMRVKSRAVTGICTGFSLRATSWTC